MTAIWIIAIIVAYIVIGILVAVITARVSTAYLDETDFIGLAIGWLLALPFLLVIGFYHAIWSFTERWR